MNLWRKFLILCIVILSFYFLFELWKQRSHIWFSGAKEGMSSNKTKTKEGMSSSTSTSIVSSLSSRSDQSLVEYVIKSSFNSAYDGTNISLQAIDNVLQHGCRWIDLEIYSINAIPVVGYSTDATYSTLISGNTLPLSDILSEIVTTAFSGSSPNPRDPLFLQLRIKSNCGLSNTSVCDIYGTVAKTIQSELGPRLYKGDVSGASTLLSDIMGKIIIVLDVSTNPNWKDYSTCLDSSVCVALNELVNMESGNTALSIQTYSDFINMEQNTLIVDAKNPRIAEPTSGALTLHAVYPDDYKNTGTSANNPASPNNFIVDNGCQIIAYKFYKTGSALDAYENLFNIYQTAFVPIGYAVQHINNPNAPIPKN